MEVEDLTTAEQELFDALPGPPAMGKVTTTNVWIVEWLPPEDRHTGRLLHDWMEGFRPGWSAYCPCRNKVELIAAIGRATKRAQQTKMVPVLHLEAHGASYGLEGPNALGALEQLTWSELTEPLQQLNLATRCNLVVVVAACTGFAGIKAFQRGPLAPAVALIGPDSELAPGALLSGTKEFYRRWADGGTQLDAIVASASRESGETAFEQESFAVLAFDAMAKNFVISMRSEEQSRRMAKTRLRLVNESMLSEDAINRSLELVPCLPAASDLQRIWDEMFMIDIYPENRTRFGVDWAMMVRIVSEAKAAI